MDHGDVVKEDGPMDRALKRGSVYLGLAGAAGIVFGIVCLVWPGISLVALTALFAAFALVYGAFAIGTGLSMLAHRSTDWVPYMLGGLGGVTIGGVTFFRPGLTVLALVYFIAAWAIVTGVFEIIAGFELRGEVRGAVWLAVSGALSLVFGALVAIRPGDGALAILWLIGLYSLLGGALRLGAAYQINRVRGDVRHAVPTMQTQS